MLDNINEWHFTTCFSGCLTDAYYTDGDTIVVETITYITAIQEMKDRNLTLKSTITSKQRYENEKIVEQEIWGDKHR